MTHAPRQPPGEPAPGAPLHGLALGLIATASAALFAGLVLPVFHLRRGFSRDTYSVITGIGDLAEGGNVLLAVIVFAFSVVFPIAKLLALVVTLYRRIDEGERERVLRRLAILGRWSMLDVFVVVILTGSVHLGILADGSPRPGVYVFAGAILLSMLATVAVSRATAGDAAREPHAEPPPAGWLDRALSIAALALFLVGLALPLMSVAKWHFWDHEYSVLEATSELLDEGEPLLAAAVLLFVVLLPLTRFAGLIALRWWSSNARAVRAVVLLDKWSMLDVFGLALLIVAVKVGDIAAVETRPGFWVLLAAVGLSLVDSWRLHRGPRGK